MIELCRQGSVHQCVRRDKLGCDVALCMNAARKVNKAGLLGLGEMKIFEFVASEN
ncbi:hypothetical protein MPS_3745 [Mycobacterium pseudoshottsii JCM 15466]|nr:hypothetical protein MPS_3745 [Mycobacterium pseudoshottsii JCM 15466]